MCISEGKGGRGQLEMVTRKGPRVWESHGRGCVERVLKKTMDSGEGSLLLLEGIQYLLFQWNRPDYLPHLPRNNRITSRELCFVAAQWATWARM